MKIISSLVTRAALVLSLLSLVESTKAQVFVYNQDNGSLLVGMRKVGASQESPGFELLINAGSVTNLLNLGSGAVTNLSNYYTATQVANAYSNRNNLNWSVSAAFFSVNLPGFPRATLWFTNPRTNVSVQSTPYTRLGLASQQNVRANVLSIGAGAVQISQNLGTATTNNTVSLVREPINDVNNLTTFIGGASDTTLSDFQGQWPSSVEITTPASFTSPVRSDLYEIRPTGNLDPHTGLTNGPAYYVGYFEMATNGLLTFTRATTNAAPPPPPTLTISRSGNTSTISFGTTNGATYNLIFTNIAGLSSPRSNWPATGPTIIGTGSATNFTDTTTSSNRVYSVKAH